MKLSKNKCLRIGITFILVPILLLNLRFLYPDSNKDTPFSPKKFSINFLIQNSHERRVSALAAGPNGKYFLSGSAEGILKVWTPEGFLLNSFKWHQGQITAISFFPDGFHFVTASLDNTIKIGSLDGFLVKTIQGHTGPVLCVALSPSAQKIISGSGDKTIKIWDLNGKVLKTIIKHNHIASAIAIDPKEKIILSGGTDGSIKIWDMDGKLLKTLKGHKKSINHLYFNPNGKEFYSASADSRIIAWDLKKGKRSIINEKLQKLDAFTYDSVNSNLVSASRDKELKIWSTDGQLRKSINNLNSHVTSLIFYRQMGKIISGSEDGSINLWSANGDLRKKLKQKGQRISALAVSPKGGKIAFSHGPGSIKIFDLQTNILLSLKKVEQPLTALSFNRFGTKLLSSHRDGSFKEWTLSGDLILDIKAHDKRSNGAIYSPDNRTILSFSDDGYLLLWDKHGRLIRTFKGHTKGVTSASFHPEGKILISSSHDGTLILWGLDGKIITRWKAHEDGASAIAFSADGRLIASGSLTGQVRVWKSNGDLLKSVAFYKGPVSDLKFDQSGKQILTSSWEGSIKLWNWAKDNVKNLNGHLAWVTKINFLPGSSKIISSSLDQTIRIWDTKGPDSLILVFTKKGEVFTFSNKGRFDGLFSGESPVGISKDLKNYTFFQIWNKFYAPGLLKNFLNGKKITPKGSFNLENRITSLPEVSILWPRKSLVTNKNAITLTVKAYSKGRRNSIRNIFLVHNGRKIKKQSKSFKLKKKKGRWYIRAGLLTGKNIFQIGAGDSSGGIGLSSKLIVHYVPKPPLDSGIHLISMNIESPQGVCSKAKGAVNVAPIIQGTFEELAQTRFSNIYPTKLSGNESSRTSILRNLQILKRKIKYNKAVIFYLRGQYIKNNKGFQIITPLSKKKAGFNIKKNTLGLNIIQNFIQNISARQILVIFQLTNCDPTLKITGISSEKSGELEAKLANFAQRQGINLFYHNSHSNKKSAIQLKRKLRLSNLIINSVQNLTTEGKGKARLITAVNLMDLVESKLDKFIFLSDKILIRSRFFNFGGDFIIGKI